MGTLLGNSWYKSEIFKARVNHLVIRKEKNCLISTEMVGLGGYKRL